jgi:hypothetical protein
MFELKPVAPQPGAIEGWHITVRAQKAAPGCGDFVSVATPPYRFDNPRYLDTGYGNTARDAVSRTPREFYFALTCADYKRMAAQVKRMLWPDSGPVARQIWAGSSGSSSMWRSPCLRGSEIQRPGELWKGSL